MGSTVVETFTIRCLAAWFEWLVLQVLVILFLQLLYLIFRIDQRQHILKHVIYRLTTVVKKDRYLCKSLEIALGRDNR